jgi:hypothetical protein
MIGWQTNIEAIRRKPFQTNNARGNIAWTNNERELGAKCGNASGAQTTVVINGRSAVALIGEKRTSVIVAGVQVGGEESASGIGAAASCGCED